MKINFDELRTEKHIDFKGGAGELLLKKFDGGNCKIMRSTLAVGAKIGLHTHESDCEILYVLSGKGYALCGGEKEELTQGVVHYCKKGNGHTVINTGDEPLEMFAVVIK